tara:strand:- start:415 stop:1113 length:699 start_codon:yes stop_codon:yes gene_type:complete
MHFVTAEDIVNQLSVEGGFAAGQLNIKGFEYTYEGVSKSNQQMQISMGITGNVYAVDTSQKINQSAIEQNKDSIKVHLKASVDHVFAKVDLDITDQKAHSLMVGINADFGNSNLIMSGGRAPNGGALYKGSANNKIDADVNKMHIQGLISLNLTVLITGDSDKNGGGLSETTEQVGEYALKALKSSGEGTLEFIQGGFEGAKEFGIQAIEGLQPLAEDGVYIAEFLPEHGVI